MVQPKKLVIVTEEQMNLIKNRKRRIACYNKWVAGEDTWSLAKQVRMAYEQIWFPARSVGGRRLSRVLPLMKKIAEAEYETEEQEYQAIGKPHRRTWSSDLFHYTFPDEEQREWTEEEKTLWRELMIGYGCYDY